MRNPISSLFNLRICLCTVLSFLSFLLNAEQPVVRNVSEGIELRNDKVSIVISEKAELVACIEIKTNLDIALHNHTKIASIKKSDGTTIQANRIVLDGDDLRLFFENIIVDIAIKAYDDYFTFEVKDDYSAYLKSLTFLDLKFKYNFSDPNPFIAVGVAMSLQTNPVFYPSGESKEVSGICTAHTGIKGAKLAVVACRKEELRDVLKTVYESVSSNSIPISLAGGPYALDNDINKGDCIIVGELNPNQVQDYIDFCSQWNISQIDFHVGSKTFIQGQFSFTSTESAKAFKEQIADPLKNAGITTLLHTYSFYIGYEANEILSNPKWQQQLEFRESYTLNKELPSNSTQIDLSGDKTELKNDSEYWSNHSHFMMIDDEIVKYSIGKNGITSCQRGQFGTRASTHPAGTVVRIIGGNNSRIAPQPGSELFYEIAHRTAAAYNEGGFGGIYFDAFDCLSIHLKNAGLEDYRWYYGASFVNEVLKYCKDTPLVEYSTLYPTLWAARGRGGAWDSPQRGYKNFIDDHIRTNKSLLSRYYVTTLGWYNFYPQKTGQQGSFSTKYMFFDDVDYLGVKAIAYDQTMVYNQLKIEDNSIPALRRNLEEYAQYNRLRTSKYFSDYVKSVLRDGKYEYKLVKKHFRWGLKEAAYFREKIHDINNTDLSGINPFKRQKPFIRLENLYSSDSKSKIILAQFDKKTDICNQLLKKKFDSGLDMSDNQAIKIVLKGNGQQSGDAICIRLMSSNSSGYSDYIVRTNFDGWRDIVLSDLDNAEYTELKFKDMDDKLYQTHRMDVDYSHITSMEIFVSGECRDVKIGTIEAVPLVSNNLANPQISIGKAILTFADTIQSGEYLEYQVGDNVALIYDNIGNSREVPVSKSGRFRIPKGAFTAKVSGAGEVQDAPSEVVLTIGLYGHVIKNRLF